MKQFLLAAALSLALPAAASAERVLDAESFDALTLGQTFTFAEQGRAYGIEQYLPNRRVRWAFLDGECKDGHWWEERGMICFAYEDNPDPQCWTFVESEAGLSARFENDPAGTFLYEVSRSPEPLECKGPEVGV